MNFKLLQCSPSTTSYFEIIKSSILHFRGKANGLLMENLMKHFKERYLEFETISRSAGVCLNYGMTVNMVAGFGS